ncbi:MAG: phage tail protein [Neisseria sp.]|nr:phage tail protein [Neisseria sp.]
MEKPASLRKQLQTALPELAAHPEKLRLFITEGEIRPNKGTLGYQQHYTLSVFVEDTPLDPAYLNIAVIDWLQTAQPDILGPHRRNERPFTFEAEPLESDRWDILIELKLTETVIARQDDKGQIHIHTKTEPHYQRELAGGIADIIGASR